MASRSSMLRIGSSIACLLRDLKVKISRTGDRRLRDGFRVPRIIYIVAILCSKKHRCRPLRWDGASF